MENSNLTSPAESPARNNLNIEKTTAAAGKACLIRPPAVETVRFSTGSVTLPLGLAYIASSLRHENFVVRIVDSVAEGPEIQTRYLRGYLVGLRFDQIVSRVPADTDFIGISVTFTHEWPAVVQLVSRLKRLHPNVPVILGGEHVSAMPEFSMATCVADFVCLGEGEETIIELGRAIVSQSPVDEIAGIAFRKKSKIIVNPRRARRRGIDDIPLPAWDLFDVNTYFKHRFVGGTDINEVTIPILATRGCPYQCTFCAAPNMWEPRWIPRDPVKVADEIEQYYRVYGARNFPFQDLTAIVRKDWIVKFCNELIRRELPISWQFPSGTRSEAIDDEVAELLLRSRMINIAYAPESGSERTRRLIKKKMKTDTLLDSVKCSVRHGLNVSLFLVLGFPHDTSADMRENLSFVKRVRDLGVNDLPVGTFMALPGTQLFDVLFEQGRIKIDRKYFSHILQSNSLVMTTTYCDHLSKFQLAYWRMRLTLAFYMRTPAIKEASAEPFLKKWFRTFTTRATHKSRLQTALSNGLANMVRMIPTYFGPRWISKAEEKTMIESWHETYCSIRSTMKSSGAIKDLPVNAEDLGKINVVAKVRHEHAQKIEIAYTPIN
jgi:anaerobic magnesium-protoporphyrin IX monomethyl ester cyclase